MTCYSVELKDEIFVKGYGFLSFARNMDKHISKNKKSDSENSRSNWWFNWKFKLLIKFQEFQKLHQWIIQKQTKKKYLEKDIYLSNKDRKLLMI